MTGTRANIASHMQNSANNCTAHCSVLYSTYDKYKPYFEHFYKSSSRQCTSDQAYASILLTGYIKINVRNLSAHNHCSCSESFSSNSIERNTSSNTQYMYRQCSDTSINYLFWMQHFSAHYFHFEVTRADWCRLPFLYDNKTYITILMCTILANTHFPQHSKRWWKTKFEKIGTFT